MTLLPIKEIFLCTRRMLKTTVENFFPMTIITNNILKSYKLLFSQAKIMRNENKVVVK